MDKFTSTDGGAISEAREIVNRPHFIIKKIEIDRNSNQSNQDFESEVDTPKSQLGRVSSQRSLAQSRDSFSRGSIISKDQKEPAKGIVSKPTGGLRSPKKMAKSVLYTESSLKGNPTALLENFVLYIYEGTNL